MRAGLDAVAWQALVPGLDVHVSIGVSTTGAGVRLDDLVRVADAAMYASKNEAAGGSTAAHAPQDDEQPRADGVSTVGAELR
jgi:GGDEF domain-containing protein